MCRERFVETFRPRVRGETLYRGCSVQTLLITPALIETDNHDVQEARFQRFREAYPAIELRLGHSWLRLGDTIVDP